MRQGNQKYCLKELPNLLTSSENHVYRDDSESDHTDGVADLGAGFKEIPQRSISKTPFPQVLTLLVDYPWRARSTESRDQDKDIATAD